MATVVPQPSEDQCLQACVRGMKWMIRLGVASLIGLVVGWAWVGARIVTEMSCGFALAIAGVVYAGALAYYDRRASEDRPPEDPVWVLLVLAGPWFLLSNALGWPGWLALAAAAAWLAVVIATAMFIARVWFPWVKAKAQRRARAQARDDAKRRSLSAGSTTAPLRAPHGRRRSRRRYTRRSAR